MRKFGEALKVSQKNSFFWGIRKKNKQVFNSCTALAFGVLALSSPAMSLAAPTGGNITGGAGSIKQDGLNTNIKQDTQKLNIDWNTFSSNVNEAINFYQPNVDAIAVNKVVGGVPSQLKGALNANGQVYILNTAGVTFYGTSQVNVGSLVATTAKDVRFEGDKAIFSGAETGKVINQGDIKVSRGGFAILAAPEVANEGFIRANLGRIELASTGKGEYAVDFRGDGLIQYIISEDEAKKLTGGSVTNTGTLRSRSGVVNITTQRAGEIVSGVVNLDGVIDADAFDTNAKGGTVLVSSAGNINQTGKITANADKGDAGQLTLFADRTGNYNGALSATSNKGKGGFIETSGKEVNFGDTFTVSTAGKQNGTWLIDPVNITIANSGGNLATSTVVTALGSNNVVINTTPGSSTGISGVPTTPNTGDGDITLNSNLTWSSNNSLSLIADDDIRINANITNSTGNGGVTLLAKNAHNDTGGGSFDGVKIDGGITLNGGALSVTAQNGNGQNGGDGDIAISTALSTKGLSLTAGGDVQVNNAATSTSTGNISITGKSKSGTGVLNASGTGNVTATITNAATFGNVNAQGGNINLSAGSTLDTNALTVGAATGTITTNSTGSTTTAALGAAGGAILITSGDDIDLNGTITN
ncbi:MAG: filamentous hemagglutinin N-terminal domain-containing protein, partial [Proteobacteria bacterium]|nr:filamentous hemagglutinin N-terminal domain-containing protein [Pseudomonadota bacterium]